MKPSSVRIENLNCRWTTAHGQAYTVVMPTVNVHFLPQLVEPARLTGSTCVVIDVLRATTTITWALEQGAARVLPCLEVADARQTAATLPAGTFLLGGERGGRRIDGFDLGNSPAEYTAERVAEKTIVFTTTNGTRAMHHCRRAGEILIAALVNARAVGDLLARRETSHLLCAGTDGEITREDILAAGAMAALVMRQVPGVELNDQARIAVDAWHAAFATAETTSGTDTSRQLAQLLADSCGGRNLIELGMQADLELAARLSSQSIVPIYRNGQITPLFESA